jgi:hypothetical protein
MPVCVSELFSDAFSIDLGLAPCCPVRPLFYVKLNQTYVITFKIDLSYNTLAHDIVNRSR